MVIYPLSAEPLQRPLFCRQKRVETRSPSTTAVCMSLS